MSCPQSDQYLKNVQKPDALKALGEEALADIGASFNCNIDYGIANDEILNIRQNISTTNLDIRPQDYLFIKNPQGNGRFIDGTTRIFVLNDLEWQANTTLTMGFNCIGSFFYEPSAILLHSSSNPAFSWCRKTLIHETLHAVSLYSRIFSNPNGVIDRHRFLNEGITECLTGYVLLKKHPVCYNAWKASSNGKCGISYKQSVRIFSSLAQIIGIKPISDFYLSVDREFNAPWARFLEAIHAAGFKNFNFQLDAKSVYSENSFRDECVKKITGFKKIYNSFRALDFTKIN